MPESAKRLRTVQPPHLRDHGHARWQLRDEAASYIRALILSGQVSPGSYVRLEPLAHELAMSVTPIREAMMMLREQGFVELNPHRGFTVCRFSARDFNDLFLIQSFIGGELAARAAERMDDITLATLEDSADRLEVLAAASDGRSFELLNDEFHGLINAVADSPRLAWLYRAALPVPRFYSTVPGWIEVSLRDHRTILESLQARDSNRSRAAMAEHVRNAGALLADHLEAEGHWPTNVADGSPARSTGMSRNSRPSPSASASAG